MTQRLGTITQVSPMLVAADGSTVGMPVSLYAPAGTPVVGDRVVFEVIDRLAVVYGNITASGRWIDYTPVLQTSGGPVVACTVNRARYMVLGKTVYAQGDITASALCTQATVTLPSTAKDRLLNCGTCGVYGATFPSDQTGLARMGSNKFTLVVSAYTGGFRDCASGSAIQWSVIYELP